MIAMDLHIRTKQAPLAAIAIWIAFVLGHSIPARAQSATMGGLAGTLVNPDGAPIADATVHLAQETTQQVRTTTTGSSGSYTFSLLPPGVYEVQFAAAGFKTARLPRMVVNDASQTVRVCFSSPPAGKVEGSQTCLRPWA